MRVREMKELILHIWRSLFAPKHDSYLFGFHKGGFQVIYNDGNKSIEMPYLTACDYAEVFGGKVVKYSRRKVIK
jgi:hypothetical protein